MSRLPVRRIIYGTSLRTNPTAKNVKVVINPEIASMLSEPKWSVRSMLPSTDTPLEQITREQLHHLLKLSALERPASQAQEDKMLKTLQTQLHFVKQVQTVDTANVKPLVAIRDETPQHIEEQTVTLEKLAPFLQNEDHVGMNGTVRRRKSTTKVQDSGWDPFDLGDGTATRKSGRYFVVNKTKAPSADTSASKSSEDHKVLD